MKLVCLTVLHRVDYLSQKLSSAQEEDRQQLREQVDRLEREIDLLRCVWVWP